MSATAAAGLVVAASVVAWVIFMAYMSLHARKQQVVPEPSLAEAAQRMPGTPVPRARRRQEDPADVTRRQFFNRAFLGAFVVGLANFGMASLDFLWPRLRGGFGTKIVVNIPGVGDGADAIKSHLASARTPEFVSDGRFWIMTFEGNPKKASTVPAYKAANTLESGVVALYRKCVHLGCSVPWCASSKWFECPCHGSKYSINGEYRDGPAPRSLDRFRVDIVGGKIVVDTSQRIEMPRGVFTSQPQPEGEHCVQIRGA